MAEIVSLMNITVADKVGGLAELTGVLKQAGINIRVACAWVEGQTGRLLLVTDDNDKACASLSEMVEDCKCDQAVGVTVANEIGSLNSVAEKLAEAGIAIKMACATTVGGPDAMILLDTSDNAKAAEIL